MKTLFYFKSLALVPIFCFCLFANLTFAAPDKDNRMAANELFEDGNYLMALPYFLDLLDKDPENIDFLFKAGVCYIYKSDEKEKSIDFLLKAYEAKPKTKNILYYLGMAYNVNYKFDEGIEAYSDALSSKKTAKHFKDLIPRLIESCKNAKVLMASPIDVEIDNVGSVINSEWSEYTPLISSDESIMIFTYRGEKSIGGRQDRFGDSDKNGSFYEDIYLSTKEKDRWLAPEPISNKINSKAHEACISLSFDGQKLYVYKDTKERPGDIYYSTLEEDGSWSKLVPLSDEINSKHSETSISVSTDGMALYFSSNRPNGVGGKDIYYCEKQKNGTWGNPVSLDAINTEYDEDAVFIHPDGKTLYFSSKGHNSMGGYDIFVAEKKSNGSWSSPKNMGYPINTAEDDIYFVVSGNGKNGYYSSGKSGGLGQQDIYVARMNRESSEHIYTMLRGQVSGNDVLTSAKIKVKNLKNGSNVGEYKTNSLTGRYIINLASGDYELTYVSDGFPEHKVIVEASDKKFVEKELNIALVTEGYVPKMDLKGMISYGEPNPIGSKLLLVSVDSSINRTLIIDSANSFTAENLPGDKNYLLTLVGVDREIEYKISGDFKSVVFDEPFAGIGVNEVYSDSLGCFEFERLKKIMDNDVLVNNEAVKILPGANKQRHAKKPVKNVAEKTKSSHKINPYDEDWYNKLLASIGSTEYEGVQYKVQVGAYFIPRNFNTIAIKRLGEIKALELNDGITRFTMGQFKKLNDAHRFREKIMKAGVQDAFVTVFINGERKLLSEISPEILSEGRTQ